MQFSHLSREETVQEAAAVVLGDSVAGDSGLNHPHHCRGYDRIHILYGEDLEEVLQDVSRRVLKRTELPYGSSSGPLQAVSSSSSTYLLLTMYPMTVLFIGCGLESLTYFMPFLLQTEYFFGLSILFSTTTVFLDLSTF